MKILLDNLSYKHRSNASSMLISKANNLLDAASVQEKDLKKNKKYIKPFDNKSEYIDVSLVAAAIDYYDMSLLLVKPYDSNYRTVANWKCNALIKLGQYEDAVAWYKEIIKTSAEANGINGPSNATVELAEKQIAKFNGLKNEAVDYHSNDNEAFNDPPFCMYVAAFINALAIGKYTDALKYIDHEKEDAYSVKTLKKNWKELVGEADIDSLSVSLESHLFEWKGQKDIEMGWCYFSISGNGISEGISVIVSKIEQQNSYAITKIEFGRP